MAFTAPRHASLQTALSIADSEAVRLHSDTIGIAHLLLGIWGLHIANNAAWLRRRTPPPLAVRVLSQNGITVRKIEDSLQPIALMPPTVSGPTPLDDLATQAVTLAEQELYWMDQRELTSGHLLLGIMLLPTGRTFLEGLGLRKWRQAVDDMRMKLQPTDNEGGRRRTTRYTRSARLVLMFAQEQARELRHTELGTEHLLLAMLGEHQGLGGRVLKNLGADVEGLKARILQLHPSEQDAIDVLGLSEQYKRLLDRASNERRLRQHSLIGTGHLLYHYLFLDDDIGMRALRRLNIRPDDVIDCLAQYATPQLPLLAGVSGGVITTDRLFTLTFEAQDSMLRAEDEARRLEHRMIDTGHLLLALMIEENSLTAELLTNSGLDRRRVRGILETTGVQDVRHQRQPYYFSEDMQTVVYLAIDAACDNCDYPVINPLHLLVGLLMQPDSVAVQALNMVDVSVQQLLMAVEQQLFQRKR